MSSLDSFKDILRPDEPLAPHTWLRVGGPAKYLAEPTNADQLRALVVCCHENDISVRLLGSGSNLLVRDEGFDGVVIRLVGSEFTRITIDDTRVKAAGGALLSNVITESVKAGLAGLEVLVGIPGTIGGALHGNAGGRQGDIGDLVVEANVLTATGEMRTRTEDQLSFSYRASSVDELVVLDCTLQVKRDEADAITERMRKVWIMKKSRQPLSAQTAGCIFKNPRGLACGDLIEQAGLKGTRIGNAEISDRHANFIVTHEGATADDVLKLIDVARSGVAEQFGVDLETEIQIW